MIYHKTHLEDYVESLLVDMNIRQPGQLNKFVISDKLGIYLHLYEGNSRGLTDDDNEKYIFLNRHLSRPERWQDFAHELCHILRHDGDQKYMSFPFRQLQEWQSNNFMYNFCVPTFMLQRIRLPPDQHEAIRLIADTFNVDYQFAEKRLHKYYQKMYYSKII